MPSIHLLLFFEFNALPFWCKSNVCWKRHQNSDYGLVTLSCTLYEYLWTGKTYLLTQWIEITLRLFTILSLNYLINPQPLLLILKILVNQGAGLDWFAKYFPSSDRMKSIKLTNEKQISIIYVPNMYMQNIEQSAMQEKICSHGPARSALALLEGLWSSEIGRCLVRRPTAQRDRLWPC